VKKIWVFSIVAIPMILAGCGQSQSEIISHGPPSMPPSKESLLPITIPSSANVKNLTAWVSTLPGSKRMNFTNRNHQSTIENVLTWLKNAKAVGVEKSSPGKGGYPPGLEITTTNTITITVEPAVNWTVKKYSNRTAISDENVAGYVAISSSDQSQVTRAYSPKLYNWIEHHEWE
jgi:hypothetical protein